MNVGLEGSQGTERESERKRGTDFPGRHRMAKLDQESGFLTPFTASAQLNLSYFVLRPPSAVFGEQGGG